MLLETLAGTVVPVLAIVFVAAIAAVNLFLSVRKSFPVRVNCWFCNTDSKVPYDSGNSWNCPSCTQYNGFTEDGDYNREIPAQYQCPRNGRSNATDDDKIIGSGVSALPRNGLCFGCNRNQELKIHQLASFVPEVEENYDAEVEEYQRQLEQTYKLCGLCERVLKRTLNDVKRNILGSKLAQIGTSGLKVLDLAMAHSTVTREAFRKRRLVANVCLWSVIVLLGMRVGRKGAQMEFRRDALEQVFSPVVSQTIVLGVSYVVAFKDTLMAQLNATLKHPVVADGLQQLAVAKNVIERKWEESASEGVMLVEESTLSCVAVICLVGMLMSVRSHVDRAKLVILMGCAAAEMVLRTDYAAVLLGKDTSFGTIETFLSFISLLTALSCLGQTEPRMAPSDNLNSSFHKIYSRQEAKEERGDLSANSLDDGDISEQTSICSGRRTAPFNSSIRSVRSLDTTKSLSPMVFTNNNGFRSFNPDSSTASTFTSPKSSYFGGSTMSVHRLDLTPSYSRQSGFTTADGSLLKAPSFSVDNFATAIPGTGPASFASTRYSGFSMSAINKTSTKMFLREDPEEHDRFGDDIDRLSISGRMSVQPQQKMVNNPFATHHVDLNESFTSQRQHGATISPPHLAGVAPESGGSWLAGGYWGMSPQKGAGGGEDIPVEAPFMSRTSSQSSGFESQPVTRRPTPEELTAADDRTVTAGIELDRVSLFSEPVGLFSSNASSISARLNQTVSNLPSPAPSFIHHHHHQNHHHKRNLFADRGLFETAPQFGVPHHPSFFPSAARSMAAASPWQRGPGSMVGSVNLGSPSQQQQQQQQPQNHRRSLLNLSKIAEPFQE